MLRGDALIGNLAGTACENRRHDQSRDIDVCKHVSKIFIMT